MIKSKLILMLCAIGITFSATTKVMAAADIHRIWGSDRYDTATEISKSGWTDGSEYAVIANGENFPDALSAAPLAKKYNAPILLNSGKSIDSKVESELKRLNVKKVFIIGGTAVVPSSVEKRLSQVNIEAIRLYGQDRYETAVKVAEQLGFNGELAIASGENFPDAMSMAPIAAQKGMPIILTSGENLPSSVAKYIKDKKINKTYVIGGNDVVSDNIFNTLPNAERLYGDSRYDTNIAVLKKFENELHFNNIYLSNGENFPDALAGSALAAKNSSAVILVSSYSGVSTGNFLSSKLTSFKTANILGGTGVVDDILVQILLPMNTIISSDAAGDYIYQLEQSAEGKCRIYKTKLKGSDRTQISDNLTQIVNFKIYKDNIYFTTSSNQLYKMNLDGGDKTYIADVYPDGFDISEDWIYYFTPDKHSLSKIKIDGSGISKIADVYGGYPKVSDGWIYYNRIFDEAPSVPYKIRLDGTNDTPVNNN